MLTKAMASDNATVLLTEGWKSLWMTLYSSPWWFFFLFNILILLGDLVWCNSSSLKTKDGELECSVFKYVPFALDPTTYQRKSLVEVILDICV